jgi:hypothetical protein
MAQRASASLDFPGVETAALSHPPKASLRGGWWLLVRSVWLLLAAGVLANFLVGLLAYDRQQQTVCTTDLAHW